MALARHKLLTQKSLNAALAALEVYNKPDFNYREETFAILMLNAWELLLKARIIQENGGDPRSIEIWEAITKKDGAKSKFSRPKKNRSGNNLTIGLERAAGFVHSYPKRNKDNSCIANLQILQEIRDISVHAWHNDSGLGFCLHEVGTASVRNYAKAVQAWFDVDMETYNFHLMPLTFQSAEAVAESLVTANRPVALENFLNQIERAESESSAKCHDFDVTVNIQLKFTRAKNDEAIKVRVANDDPNAPVVRLSEEMYKVQFPWDYRGLTNRLKERYVDFVENSRYHRLRQAIESDQKLCWTRYLDPEKKRGVPKRYYSPNILRKFDEHYVKP